MVHRTLARGLVLLVLGVNPLWVGPACAALGSGAASVREDVAELHGVVNAQSRQQYDIQQIDTDTGIRVREFLNRAGMVFAVSWTGPVLPDLKRLLGAHFAEYTTALASLHHPGLQRSVQLASPGLVVESSGHLRAYAGRVYLPDLIPAGVSAAELR